VDREGVREGDGESTEEVEGRSLASIRERDADRVGESWVRSHKEVDTRRHLNPPCPPSRRSLPRLVSPGGSCHPRRALPHTAFPVANLRPSSFPRCAVASFCFASSRSVRLTPDIYLVPLSPSRPSSAAILALSFSRAALRGSLPTLRDGTHPRSTKREAKATRGTSRVVGGFFCYYRQMLCLVKHGEEGRDGEIERARRTETESRKRERRNSDIADGDGRGGDGSGSGTAADGLAARGMREKLRRGRSEEVERGKSPARSTIFPSRRAVTFYLASFGECGKKKFRFSCAEKVTRALFLSLSLSLAGWMHISE